MFYLFRTYHATDAKLLRSSVNGLFDLLETARETIIFANEWKET